MPASDGKLTIGILVFDDVEVLDFSGPFEVFSVAGRLTATGKNRAEQTQLHMSTSLHRANNL